MTVIAVLTAVNDQKSYTDCVDLYLDSWKKISATSRNTWIPLIIKISKNTITLESGSKNYEWSLLDFKTPTSLISQVSRLLVPSFVDADFIVTTDIDMLPLNLRVFDRALVELESGSGDFVVCRDVLKPGQFPMCYNIASPKIWGEIFPTNLTLELSRIWARIEKDFDGRRGKRGWYFDQEYLHEKLSTAELRGLRVIKMKDSVTMHRRLDISRRNILLWPLITFRILQGSYSDFHLKLPLSKHRVFIVYILFLNALRVRTHSAIQKLSSVRKY